MAASVTTRASGFWADRMDYFDDAEQGMDDVEADSEVDYDGRTPLDKTIDRIGMGASYFRISCVLALMYVDQGVTNGHFCHCAGSVSTILQYTTSKVPCG
jgi:hypothetical protein